MSSPPSAAHSVLVQTLTRCSPHGRALVHRVEGGDRRDLGRGELQGVGAEPDAVLADVTLDGLHEVQQRQQRRARLRVPGDDLLGPLARDLVEHAADDRLVGRARPDDLLRRAELRRPERLRACLPAVSSVQPPMTGSMLATAAMTSAIMPPSLIAGIDCRFTKLGSRRCTRIGRVPPSETRWQPSSPRGDSTAVYTWPGGTAKPSVTSLKWWISDSID